MGLSQEKAAQKLDLTRSTLSSYENGTCEPNFTTLKKFSSFFDVSLDYLLGLCDESQLNIPDVSGRFLRVLSSTHDQYGQENIELVPEKAKAGYRTGFADPEFIKVLPAFQLPFLSKQKKYRSFQISGDSMPPLEDGAYVTAEFVENWHLVKDGFPYIVVTKNDGVVFKVLYNKIKQEQNFLLCSTNTQYQPYSVPIEEISEIWKFVNFISSAAPGI